MADISGKIRVQVCYVTPQSPLLIDLEVSEGTTLESAIRESGILQRVPDIDLSSNKIGIYGKVKTLDTILRDCDRVEIYRRLIADPKDARRRRVAKKEHVR
ncbi:MAG: RnfH family protein [Burkholderiales bacterium]|nr:RnfH family protein [Burkholderiales bacterium]